MQAITKKIRKNTFCAPIRARFHTLNVIFSMTDCISNRSEEYESMLTEDIHVQLTWYKWALIIPLFFSKFIMSNSVILVSSGQNVIICHATSSTLHLFVGETGWQHNTYICDAFSTIHYFTFHLYSTTFALYLKVCMCYICVFYF